MAAVKTLYSQQLAVGLETVKKAMAAILLIYRRGFAVKLKADNSPVTDADLAANRIIKGMLSQAFPSYGILSEEDKDDLSRLDREWVFVIDPLDGTEDFVHRDNQFCINIGLVRNHRAVMGIVAIPLTGEIFYAYAGRGAFVVSDTDPRPRRIQVSDRIADLVAVASPFHTTPLEDEVYKADPRVKGVLKVGSAIKSCLVAEGKADVSLKLGPGTKEWDTCAPQVVVTEAGGFFLTPAWTEMLYNKPDVQNHTGYCLANRFANLLSADVLSKRRYNAAVKRNAAFERKRIATAKAAAKGK